MQYFLHCNAYFLIVLYKQVIGKIIIHKISMMELKSIIVVVNFLFVNIHQIADARVSTFEYITSS